MPCIRCRPRLFSNPSINSILRNTSHHIRSCGRNAPLYNCRRPGARHPCNRQHSTKSHTFERPQLTKDRAVHPLMSIPVVCFILGYWQVQRRQAKLQLLSDIESRCDMEAKPFDSEAEYLEYTPVEISGEYDYSSEFYLGPRHEVLEGRDKGEAGGYHSIVPMTLDSGERVLVDRGWVQVRTDIPAGQIAGRVTQVGLIRRAEGAVMGVLAPKPGSSQTYIWRDTEVMAQISNSLPITVELKEDYSIHEGPLAGQTRLTLYNKHMEYIITWWGMGIASLFYIFTFKRKPKVLPKIFK